MSSIPPTDPVPEETSKKHSAILQPKMQQKISLRFALGLFGVAALFLGWYFLRDFLQDPDSGTVNSAGWIAAVRQTSQGEQVVVIKPDGSIVDSPGYNPGSDDRDVVWQPDGQRIFFTSNRDKEAKGGYHVWRWNVSPRNTVEQRSVGTHAQEHPTYPVDGTIAPPYTQLLISAGVVVDFDPKTSTAHQLIPVEGKNPTQDKQEGGDTNQFGPEYEHLGSSYREAYWCKNHKYIVGVMHRDDTETLVVQCMQPVEGGNPMDDGLPHGILAGDHIDMAVDPKSGNVVYAVVNFQLIDPSKAPPSMVKNGKVISKYRNIIGFVDLDDMKQSRNIVAWPTADRAFSQPQVSPDGTEIAFIGGSETPTGFQAIGLFICPVSPGPSGSTARQLISGPVGSPCWSPDGSLIAFDVRQQDGHSDIVQIDSGGANYKILTSGKGSFTSPKFSPTMSKPGS